MARGRSEGSDLLLVHASVGGGHTACARAIAEHAQRLGKRTESVDVFESAPAWARRAYVGAHLAGQTHAPQIYDHAFHSGNRRDDAWTPIRREIDRIVFGRLVPLVRRLSPRAIVATHHLPLVVLGRARRTGMISAPLFAAVTDYTAHAVWAEPGVDAFFVATPRAREELVAFGASPARVLVTGIPVRPGLGDSASRDADAARHRVRVRVLVTSGGFGVGPLEDIVQSFEHTKDVVLTVVCGRNELVQERVRHLAERLGISANVLGFERDMARRMRETDIVVGKAGGLTLTESLASGKPMIIVGPIAGQERSNAAFAMSRGAARLSTARDVGPLITLIARSGELDEMRRHARTSIPTDSGSAVVAWIDELAAHLAHYAA